MGTAPSCIAVNHPDGTQTFLPSGPTESQRRKGKEPKAPEPAEVQKTTSKKSTRSRK